MLWGALEDWLRAIGTSAPVAYIPATDAERLARAALAVAIEEIGKGETEGNNRGPDIRRYMAGFLDAKGRQRPDGGAWCGAFASFTYRTAGARTLIEVPFELHTGAKRLARNAGAAGRTFRDPEEASPGDLIAWNRGAPGDWTGHVGLVERVKRGLVYTIEGNKGPAGRARVQRLIHDVSREPDFYGFASIRDERDSRIEGPILVA